MRTLLAVLLASLAACSAQNYNFNEGPPRAHCRADDPLAHVGKPWTWSCVIEGSLSAWADEPIGIQLTTFRREEFPERKLATGLLRIYNYRTVFDGTYYLDLRGARPFEPGERIEPSSPADPLPPIEGYESLFDGSFWIRIEFFEIESFDGRTAIRGKKLTEGTVRGRLSCNQCAV